MTKKPSKSPDSSPFSDPGESRGKAMNRLLSDIASLGGASLAEDSRIELATLRATNYMRLAGGGESAVDALLEALGKSGLGLIEQTDVADEAARRAVESPSIKQKRQLEAGLSLINFTRALIEYDDRGDPQTPNVAEVVMARWPNLRFFENPGTTKIDNRGIWLEIREGRWHHLMASEVEIRARRVIMAKADGKRLESEQVNKQAREAMRDLHVKLRQGETTQIDASDHLLDSSGLPINLKTGKPCDPNWHYPLMSRLAVEYRPEAKSESFVDAVTQCLSAGRKPEDGEKVVAWFKRMSGYMLLKHKKEQILVMNVGIGNNGKSTIMEAMMGYLGDSYAHTMDPDPLLQDFKGDPLTGFNSMVGKLMTLVEELPEGRAVSPATLKRISGGRKMEIRKRYEDNKVVLMTSMLWINSNVRPEFWDNTKGWRRRYVFVEWMMDFVAEVVNKDKAIDLQSDGSGWFNWALDGLREYLEVGEKRPGCIKDSTQAYSESSGDPLRTFYDKYLKKQIGATPILLKDLKTAYENWLVNSDEVNDEEHAKRFAGTPQKFRKKVANMTGCVEKGLSVNMYRLVDHVLADDGVLNRLPESERNAGGLGVKVVDTPIPPEGDEGMVGDKDWE